ncbi:hypothetical protein KY360_00240 [Candidatus Woesearchaeota archaeon]|nr:hypothetical protein [Candidatus Woesearchaeota archaeon]
MTEVVDEGRRVFLKRLLVAGAGAALAPLEAIAETKHETTFYVARMKRSRWRPEVFEHAMDYLREEVGVDAGVEYCSRSELEKAMPDFDVRTKVAIMEVPAADYARYSLFTQFIHDEEFRNRGIEDWLNFFNKRKNTALGMVSDRVIFLSDRFMVAFGKEYEKTERGSTLVHEIGHLAGLWHTHAYTNDGLEDYVGEIPNVMSYKDPLLGKGWGFDMTPEQKAQMRDYFSGGETYRKRRADNFKIGDFFARLELERGYSPEIYLKFLPHIKEEDKPVSRFDH